MRIRHRSTQGDQHDYIEHIAVNHINHNESGWSDLFVFGVKRYLLGGVQIFRSEGHKSEYKEVRYGGELKKSPS